jgi:hypothetical protein
MPLSTPTMSSTIAANGSPFSVDLGSMFGKVYVGGALSGLVNAQTNAISPPDHDWFGDLSNAQVFVQKTDGPVQFFLDAGVYSFPSLGFPYAHVYDSKTVPNATFGYLPVAYLKLAPTSEFSIIAGKLPTLVGAEYGFTYQNVNINRGLLWAVEPIVSRGVQANYAKGPLTISLSLTDGYYSNRYNWLTGLVSLAVTKKDTVAIVGGGNLGSTPKATTATPQAYNNGQIYNLLWTHTEDKWVFNPYFQYQHVDAKTNPVYYWTHSGATWGIGGLAKYQFSSEWNLGFRAEYMKQTGTKGDPLAPFLLYGAGSDAYTLTFTPTYQHGVWFVRGEGSYVHANVTAFGSALDKHDQFRFSAETGVVF